VHETTTFVDDDDGVRLPLHTDTRLLLSGGGSDLGLGRSAHLLRAVLLLLALLTRRLAPLVQTVPSQSMFRFKLLGEIEGVVHQSESGRFTATKVRLETKDEDNVGCGLVHLGQLFTDLSLRNGRPTWVEDVDHHLSATQQPVCHELPRTNCRRSFGHFEY